MPEPSTPPSLARGTWLRTVPPTKPRWRQPTRVRARQESWLRRRQQAGGVGHGARVSGRQWLRSGFRTSRRDPRHGGRCARRVRRGRSRRLVPRAPEAAADRLTCVKDRPSSPREHPRARGPGSPIRRRRVSLDGTSARPRARHDQHVLQHPRPRNGPAPAGAACTDRWPDSDRPERPRARGGGPRTGRPRSSPTGTAPRSRGRRLGIRRLGDVSRRAGRVEGSRRFPGSDREKRRATGTRRAGSAA